MMSAKREADTKNGEAAADADVAEASAPLLSPASSLASPSLPSDLAANVSPEMAEVKSGVSPIRKCVSNVQKFWSL